MDIRELINNCDPTDANYCMEVLDVGRKLAKWAQIAINTDNQNMHMGRDDKRELAMAVLDYGRLIRAWDYGSPSAEEAQEFRESIIK